MSISFDSCWMVRPSSLPSSLWLSPELTSGKEMKGRPFKCLNARAILGYLEEYLLCHNWSITMPWRCNSLADSCGSGSLPFDLYPVTRSRKSSNFMHASCRNNSDLSNKILHNSRQQIRTYRANQHFASLPMIYYHIFVHHMRLFHATVSTERKSSNHNSL